MVLAYHFKVGQYICLSTIAPTPITIPEKLVSIVLLKVQLLLLPPQKKGSTVGEKSHHMISENDGR